MGEIYQHHADFAKKLPNREQNTAKYDHNLKITMEVDELSNLKCKFNPAKKMIFAVYELIRLSVKK